MEVLEGAREQGFYWDDLTCLKAIQEGNIEVLKWAREHGCPWDREACIAAAKETGVDLAGMLALRVLGSEQAEAGMGVGLQVVQRLRNYIAASCGGKCWSVCGSWPLAWVMHGPEGCAVVSLNILLIAFAVRFVTWWLRSWTG